MGRHSKTGVRGLYRDADGRYRIDLRWTDVPTGKGRRYNERLPEGLSAGAAKERARSLLAAAFGGTFDSRPSRRRTVAVALDEYLKWAKTNRPRTLRDRESLARLISPTLGKSNLDELTPFDVERLKRDRREAGAAPATVNRAVAMLKHMCTLAVTWDWLHSDKAAAIRGVRLLREPPGRVRHLAEAEEKQLFAAMPPGILPLVKTALLTGMRLGEIVTLRKDAVDLGARLVTLTRTKSNRVRRVPINDELAAVLKDAIRRSPIEYVFISRLRQPYTRDAVSQMFHRAVLQADLADLRFHDLRHDYATRLRRSGVGLDVIAELLGHSSLAVTQRYAHIDLELLREAVRHLNSARNAHPRRQKRDGARRRTARNTR